ncbi:MAG: monovalent cation:proton antiporter-2 (CPA2) family protein [Pseudomonadota bacterium]
MAGAGDAGFLQDAAIYLGAAVVAVPLFKRLKLGSVLGYLTAGVLIGPSALGLISPDGGTNQVAEFGVVLLLFVIGLELKPTRLWRLRGEIFGLGLVQVVATSLLIGVIAWGTPLWGDGLDWRAAAVAGAGLALSSTAFAIQILREKGDLSAPYGDRSFAILLFQDLAIVPLLALVAFIAPPSAADLESGGVMDIVIPIAAIAGVVAAGHYLLRPMFRIIALTRADEVFTAAALLVVVAAAWAMAAAGLSMALGAFLAGVLLAESEFRHQLETDIEPFRGLLMGLFFISIGMGMRIDDVLEQWGAVLLGVAVLVVLKSAVLFLLARAAGSPRTDALRIAAVLCQGGEFGFVIFAVALSEGVLGARDATLLNAVVTLSLAATPFVVAGADMLAKKMEAEREDADAVRDVAEAPDAPIIIAGFGRFGQVIGRILRLREYDVTLIDNDPRRIQLANSFGNEVFFGDARRLDTLANAGADQAKAIFLCIDDRDGARQAVEKIRDRFPNTRIFASTYDRFSMLEMERAGAHVVERESFESAVALARKALAEFGDGEIVDDLIQEFRRRDQQLLKLQAEYGAYEGLRKLRDGFTLEKER